MTAAVSVLVLLVVWSARRRAAFDAHVARAISIVNRPQRDELAERRRA